MSCGPCCCVVKQSDAVCMAKKPMIRGEPYFGHGQEHGEPPPPEAGGGVSLNQSGGEVRLGPKSSSDVECAQRADCREHVTSD